MSGTPERRRKRRGWVKWVVLFLIADSVLILGLWDFLQPKTSEEMVRAYCEEISAALDVYNAQFGSYGGLAQLAQAGCIEKELGSGEKLGYCFELELSDDGDGWMLVAEPLQLRKTSCKVFTIRKSGPVRYSTEELIVPLAVGEDPILHVHSDRLRRTTVASHIETPITPGKNLLYCSTFQLAWNELKNLGGGGNVHLKNGPAMVALLNKSISTKKDISEDAYVAMAGLNRDGILEKVRKALRDKFGDKVPGLDISFATPDDILAFAFLRKNLKFKTEFEPLKEPVTFYSNRKRARVRAFGVKQFSRTWKNDIEISKQVSIIDYKGDSDFIIRLSTGSPNDEIILAKVKPEKTLLTTVDAIMERVLLGRKERLDDNDTLQIPRFNFDITHSYRELQGKYFQNKGFEHLFIGAALQMIRFKLNEKGALLESGAVAMGMCARGFNDPKKLIFDRPFLIYLKEKDGKYPYFALWVDNPELLVKE